MPIESVAVSAYKIPTSSPEADGTFAWNSTTIVIVHIAAGGETGLGYTYADTATARLIHDLIGPTVSRTRRLGHSSGLDGNGPGDSQFGPPGIASMAIAAVDVGAVGSESEAAGRAVGETARPARRAAPVYGSGGFTRYSIEQLQAQLGGWVAAGIPRVKMKIGSEPDDDLGSRAGGAARRSARRSSFSSMPTGPTAASRRWHMAEHSPSWA